MNTPITENDIRPKEIFEKFLALSKLDGEKLDRSKFIFVNCPGCYSEDSSIAFIKDNYKFNKCNECFTLYCSPRPSEEQLDTLYFNSESSIFWSKVFFPTVSEARRDKLFKPKAKTISKLITEKGLDVKNICDVGAGHGLMLEELRNVKNEFKLYAVEPGQESSTVCRSKGIEVLQTISTKASEWHGKFDFVMSNEVIEHVYSPYDFIKSLCELTSTGGHTLVTGLGYEGFDILTLQEKSNSVSAPHHLNFMSINGFEKLFKRAGFSEVEIWTPGALDINIVLNSSHTTPFLEAIARRGENTIREFQEFLVRNQLSSHIWILAKK